MRNKLPFRQPLPGVFSAIDSITKQVVHDYFDAHGHLPPRLAPLGEIVRYHEPPHWSRFNTVIEGHGILLTGAADGIFERRDGSYFIVDYNTAKFTDAQDELLPMYETQLNVYALLGERCGFRPVSDVALVYMEPMADEPSHAGRCHTVGFHMGFSAHVISVELKRDPFDPLLVRVREIQDRIAPPPGRPACENCQLVDRLVSVAQRSRETSL